MKIKLKEKAFKKKLQKLRNKIQIGCLYKASLNSKFLKSIQDLWIIKIKELNETTYKFELYKEIENDGKVSYEHDYKHFIWCRYYHEDVKIIEKVN